MIAARLLIRSAMAAALLLLASGTALANAGRLGGGGDINVSLGRIIGALLISIFVAVLAILLVRQRMGKTDLRGILSRFEVRQRAIHVVETRRLSPHADVCLIRHAEREYLVLLMAGDARVLREEPYAAELPQREIQT